MVKDRQRCQPIEIGNGVAGAGGYSRSPGITCPDDRRGVGVVPRQLRDYAPAPATRLVVILATLLLAGCQSVVDPGRSMRPIPTNPSVVIPSGPVIPPSADPRDSSSIGRQPASSTLQLPQSDAAEATWHTVKAGDTWSSMSRQYGLTVPQLTDANGIDPATPLQPGQMIYIPEK